MEHARRNISYTRLSVPTDADTLVPLRITELGDTPIHCRSGLSDLGVVYDTFDGRFHLPPEDLDPVRKVAILVRQRHVVRGHDLADHDRQQLATFQVFQTALPKCPLRRSSL